MQLFFQIKTCLQNTTLLACHAEKGSQPTGRQASDYSTVVNATNSKTRYNFPLNQTIRFLVPRISESMMNSNPAVERSVASEAL